MNEDERFGIGKSRYVFAFEDFLLLPLLTLWEMFVRRELVVEDYRITHNKKTGKV